MRTISFVPISTSVILADDHPTFRLGLKQIVATDDTFAITGEAGDGLAALALIREQEPMIAVVDWDMPGLNGLDLVQEVRRERLPTRVIMGLGNMTERARLMNGELQIRSACGQGARITLSVPSR